MVNYQQSRIYRLVCNNTNQQYVGSTTQSLRNRLAGHVANYKIWQKSGNAYVTSFEIIKGGNYDIILLENYPCETKDQLHARERHYIETTDNVNRNIPSRT
eukprot:55557-Eustigmatos_ZCMA.PRE.1